MADIVSVVLLIIILFVLVLPAFFVVYAYFVDRNQKRHSVLRNYPVLGRIRYMFEKIGPELRQYFSAMIQKVNHFPERITTTSSFQQNMATG